MHFSILFGFLTAALASPVLLESEQSLDSRQVSAQSDELVNGICQPVTFIFARGSTEPGNMGIVIGPPLGNQLKLDRVAKGGVAVQGVQYAALLETNYLPGGTDAVSIQSMVSLLNLANTKCPNTQIVVGGYSQGAAVVHGAIPKVSSAVIQKIKAVVLFGDTQKVYTNSAISNYPTSQLKIFCDNGLDLVCAGNLGAAVLAPHLSYGANALEAARFLDGFLS